MLDNVITDNQTRFKLNGENATVTRNQGFTLRAVDFTDYTFTLGSATTDVIFDLRSSSGGGSPKGTLATQNADFTILGTPEITTGTTISSTGGTFTFADGITINGAAISLQNTKLAVGSSLTKTGGTFTLNQADLELLSDLTLNSDAALAFTQLKLENNHLDLQSVPSFTVGQKLVLDNANEKLTWSDNTELILSGGVQLDTNGSLGWKKPDNLDIGDITLNGGSLTIGDTSAQTFELDSGIVLQADSAIKFNSGSTLNYSGPSLAVAKALTLEGSGQMQNTNSLNLSGANGKLNLSGISLTNVITSANNSGLSIDNSSTVTNFSVSNLTPVSIASGDNLSGSITVNAGGTIQLNAAGTLAADSSLAGGTLKVNQSSTVSGMVSIMGDSTIEVATIQTVIFSDGVINTENYELTLNNSGTVSFPQNSSGIVLNNANGLLKLQGTGTVQEVQVTTASNTGKGIVVNASGTVSSLMISAAVSYTHLTLPTILLV